jgi:hypothetical protein
MKPSECETIINFFLIERPRFNFPFNDIYVQSTHTRNSIAMIFLLPYTLAGFEPGLSALRQTADIINLPDLT